MNKTLKQIWYFIWEDNSVLSWVVNIGLAFIIIKFLVYPGLGFVLSTSNPVVAVVSCSMEHQATNCGRNIGTSICGHTLDTGANLDIDEYWTYCGEWYEGKNISKENFTQFSFKNGFGKGDLIILKGVPPEDVSVGDVIVFQGGQRDPVIHRVVKKDKIDANYIIATKGDNNEDQLNYEESITKEQIVGRATFRLPLLGYVKIIFTDILTSFR